MPWAATDCLVDFENTYEPEIALFAPPPPATPREAVSTPSTAFRGSLPSDKSSQWPNNASLLNGIKAEEASVVQQVSLRQRGARLSFLGGRKQELEPTPETEQVNGGTDAESTHRRSLSKSTSRRQSIFRSQSIDEDHNDKSSGQGRRSSSVGKESLDKGFMKDGKTADLESPGMSKRGSVRKRFSMLKLGKKSSKTDGVTMGSLNEE